VSDEQPTAAAVLGIIGGVLVFIGGIFLGAIGGALNGAGYYQSGNAVGALGLFGDLLGIFIVIVSIRIYSDPEHHVGYGVTLIILGILSLGGGAGFFLGLILCVIGGILAIVWEDDDTPDFPWREPGYNADRWSAGSDARPSTGTPLPATSSPTAPTPRPPVPTAVAVAGPPPTAGKTCPNCRSVFDTARQYCPQCGAFVP
jgi:hypothetical protein